MIEWYQELYQDACTQKKWKKIRRKAEKGKPVSPGIKFICLASNPENLLDIMEANDLLFPYYRKKDIFVVGTASGMDAAKEMVEQMIFDIYTRTNGFDVRSFFVNKKS